LAEIPDAVKNALEIVPVSRMEEVLKHALVRQPRPIVWEEDVKAATKARASDDEAAGVVAH
jgi:ATP-dependent Lon protease